VRICGVYTLVIYTGFLYGETTYRPIQHQLTNRFLWILRDCYGASKSTLATQNASLKHSGEGKQ